MTLAALRASGSAVMISIVACGAPPEPASPPPPTVAIPPPTPVAVTKRARIDVVIDGEKHVDGGEIEGVDEIQVLVTRRADGGADVVIDGHGDPESVDWWLARVSRGTHGAIPPMHVDKREGGRFHLETSLDASQAGLW